jgi:hypothetical protein
MTQAPAVPKSRRLLHRLRARILGPDPGYPGLAASEQAALALARARRGEVWAAPDHVTFLIPLVGRETVGDWDRVTGLLAATLESLQAQSDKRWRAVICCQDAPALPADPRITHLPFRDPLDDGGNDKWRKLAALYAHLETIAATPGLAMTFDADDRAGPDLVAALLARPVGALITEGLVYDAAADRLAQARPQSLARPGAKAFWKLCGSCAAQPFDPGQPSHAAQFAYLREMAAHEHRMIPHLAALARHRLAPLGGQEVLYLLNHGENFGARRGRVSFKTRFAERFEIRDDALTARLRALYRL